MTTSTTSLVVLVLVACAQGYDEAGCNVRSNKTYYSGINGICRLPLGATPLDEDENGDGVVPFQMNRCSHTESSSSSTVLDTVYGLLACFLACVMFGSMFIPVKKFNTGDGMFFQWMMAIGIFLVGLVFNVAVWSQPSFFYLSMTGGILWGSGNVLTVPSLKLVGMGVSQTMVGLANLVGGWISGRFILCQPLKNPTINSVGVAVVIVSAVLLSFVSSDGRKKKSSHQLRRSEAGYESIINDYDIDHHTDETTPIVRSENPEDDSDVSWVDKLGKWPARFIGLALSSISGLMYGFQFLPIEFLRNCDHDAFSCNELDYVFGQYVGILICSTLWFIGYCFVKRFKPQVYKEIILPGIVSGIMFGIGTAMWVLANKYVGLSVAFPIITSGSGIVSSAWGVLVFREITDWKSIVMFLIAFLVVLTGIILTGLSH